MIVLVGKSGSGKTTIEKELCKSGYEKIVTYTTRPKRDGEINSIDYHFITEEQFISLKNEKYFAATSEHDGYYYAVAGKDCKGNKVVSIVPDGVRQLKEKNIKFTSFYLEVSIIIRYVRMKKRGDSLSSILRRLKIEEKPFRGADRIVDVAIPNINLNETVGRILRYINIRVILQAANINSMDL